MTTKMVSAWVENSELRLKECMRGGTPREKISVVPHAIDLETFNPKHKNLDVWKREGVDIRKPILIHVGSFNEELKGIENLVKSFRLMTKNLEGIQLVLIGEKGPLLKDEWIGDNLFYLGPRYGHELATLVASADAFIGLSRYETFWYTPLEAMASGVPIFATPVGAVPLMVTEQGKEGMLLNFVDHDLSHGWTFQDNISEKVKDAVMPFLSDRSLLKKMGKRARLRSEEFFNENRLGHDLVEVFHGARAN